MEDVEFKEDHSNSELPEAGNDPSDPLRPEIDEENSTPNPTIAEPYQDMEVTEDKEEMPDNDDIQAGLSDNESVLSDALDDDQLDEQFGEFDASNIAIEERAIDEDTVKQIGVHKRKRTAGEGEEPKKKKKRADKPRRKKNKDGDEAEGADDGTRKSKRSKKEGGGSRARAASPDDNEDHLTPEERK
jgi:transcription factor SPN1